MVFMNFSAASQLDFWYSFSRTLKNFGLLSVAPFPPKSRFVRGPDAVRQYADAPIYEKNKRNRPHLFLI